jgi:hypothetical protein
MCSVMCEMLCWMRHCVFAAAAINLSRHTTFVVAGYLEGVLLVTCCVTHRIMCCVMYCVTLLG